MNTPALKKSLLILASVGISLSLTACGSGQSSMDSSQIPTSSSTASPATTQTGTTNKESGQAGDKGQGGTGTSASQGDKDKQGSSSSSESDKGTQGSTSSSEGDKGQAGGQAGGDDKGEAGDKGQGSTGTSEGQGDKDKQGSSSSSESDKGTQGSTSSSEGDKGQAGGQAGGDDKGEAGDQGKGGTGTSEGQADKDKQGSSSSTEGSKGETGGQGQTGSEGQGSGKGQTGSEGESGGGKSDVQGDQSQSGGGSSTSGDTSSSSQGGETSTPEKEPQKQTNIFEQQLGTPSVSCSDSQDQCVDKTQSQAALIDDGSTTPENVASSIAKAEKMLDQSKGGNANVYVKGDISNDTNNPITLQNTDPSKFTDNLYLMGDISSKGEVDINGDVNVFLVGKTITGPVDVSAGGQLSGSGAITGAVYNRGNLVLHGIVDKDKPIDALAGGITMKPLKEDSPISGLHGLKFGYNGTGLAIKGNYKQGPSGVLDLRAPTGNAPVSLFVDGTATLDGQLKVQTDANASSQKWVTALVSTGEISGNFSSVAIADENFPDLDLQGGAPQRIMFEQDGKQYNGIIYGNSPYMNLQAKLSKGVSVQESVPFVYCPILKESYGFVCDMSSQNKEAVNKALNGQAPLYSFTKKITGSLEVTAKQMDGGGQGSPSYVVFLDGVSGKITLKEGKLILATGTYQDVDLQANTSFTANGHISGTLTANESSMTTVRSDLSAIDFGVTFLRLIRPPKESPVLWIADTGSNSNKTHIFQYPVGLQVGTLDVKSGATLLLDHSSLYVQTKLNVESGAKVYVTYPAQKKTYYGIVVVADSGAQVNFPRSTLFRRDTPRQETPLTVSQADIKTAKLLLVEIPAASASATLSESTMEFDAAPVRKARSNVERVAQQAKPEIQDMAVTNEQGKTEVLPVAKPTVLSRYASLLETDKTAAQALEGAEFTQALSNNARTRVFLSNDNLFQLLGSQGLRSPKVAADALYLKTYADGHADLEQLSLTAPVPGGLARVSVNRVGSSFNASYSAPNKGEVDGKKPANSSTTAYGVHALLAQDFGRFNPALSGVSAQVQGAFEYYNNKLNRLVDSKLDALEVKYGQSVWSLGLSVAKRVAVSPEVVLTPFAGYRFAYESQESIDQSLMKDLSLQVGKQNFVRNSLVGGATLRWVAPKGPLQGLSAEAGVALSYRFNAPKDYTASVKGADQSVNIVFKDNKAFSTQLKLGVNYQFEQFSAGLNTQLYYAAGLNYSFGASAALQF